MARDRSNPRALELRASLAAALPADYRPWRHVCGNFGVVALALALVLAGLREVEAAELLAVPCAFLAMSLLEYVSHRFPMHRKIRGAEFVFEAHALRHHASFPAAHMAIRSSREIGLIVFGVREIAGFLLAILPGLGLVLALGSANFALLVVAMVLVHYLLYESLHLLAHLPDDHPIARWPIFASARRRHARHHAAAGSNFNVTPPVFDWLLGTLR